MSRHIPFRGRSLTACSIAALCVGFGSGAASAQAVTPAQIDRIEQQIQSMQGQLKDLKTELGDTKQQLRQSREETRRAQAQLRAARAAASQAQRDARSAQASESSAAQSAARAQAIAAAPPAMAMAPPPPAKPGPHAAQTAGNRFGIESADGKNSIYLTGRLQLDVGDYLNYHAASLSAATQDLNSGVNARRARIGVTGKFGGDWAYTLIYDFGGSDDGLPPTAGAPSSGVQTAQITYNGLGKMRIPLYFDIGYLKVPFTLEQATSSNDMPFVERPSSQAIAAAIVGGSARSAVGIRSNDSRYFAGVYLTGPASGVTHSSGEQFGATGRLTYQVLQNPEYSLHIGADAGGLLKPPTVGGVQTISLSDRPELRIDPTSILSTGSLGAIVAPVDSAAVYGMEAAAGYRNFFLQGEYYHTAVGYQGAPSNGFDGGYVEGSWTLTGEARQYNPATGAYLGIVPKHPFSPWSNDWGLGAWEVAARYSTIDLNDAFSPAAVTLADNAVAGGRQTVYSAALNWYPNRNMRFMLDYLHGDISKQYSGDNPGASGTPPIGTPIGGKFDAVVLRSQFAF